MKKRHPIHRIAAAAWCYAVKRKLLTVLSAILLGSAGLAGEQMLAWACRQYALHRDNAAAVPRLNQEMLDVRNQLTALDLYTNADYWRWKRQCNENTNLQQQIDRKRSK
jgi:hypothetical protein